MDTRNSTPLVCFSCQNVCIFSSCTVGVVIGTIFVSAVGLGYGSLGSTAFIGCLTGGSSLILFSIGVAFGKIVHLIVLYYRKDTVLSIEKEFQGALTEKASLETIQDLLTKGADINERFDGGVTPLHLAARYHDTDVVAFLLQNGADIKARTDLDEPPSYYALNGGSSESLKLLYEAEGGTPGKMGTFLEECNKIYDIGLDIPALHLAAQYDDRRLIETMLDQGADFNALTPTRKTALHYAAMGGNVKVLKLFQERKLFQNIDIKDHKEQTPLHLAIECIGDLSTLESTILFLINEGADVNAQTSDKETPLALFEQRRIEGSHEQIARVRALLTK